MSVQSRAAVGIALGAALGSILLTAAVFLLLRRHEALVAARMEAMMAPIVREKITDAYYLRRLWLSNFKEEALNTRNGEPEEFTKVYMVNYFGSYNGLNFTCQFCIAEGAPPQFDSAPVGGGNPASHDILAAIDHYFDGQLDLGIDHRVIERLLFGGDEQNRWDATEFLINKAALSFCNFESNPKYALLPTKILELAEEINVRGFKALDKLEDRGYNHVEENHFPTLYQRWRVLTCKLYGRETMPPEIQISIDRRIDFLLTVFGPILKPECLVEARAALQGKMMDSLQVALYCVGQPGLIINNWDFIGPGSKVIYVGEPERISPFDMMAEKTLVLRPAWLQVNSAFHGLPYVNAYVEAAARVVKFTDEEWAKLTDD